MTDRTSTLRAYSSRREFRKSPEPTGDSKGPSSWKKDGNPIFVIQEHLSRSHHFDFRLEVDGVLKSWAVPKGPSTDPADKRLAVRVEDHPLDYADFEGVTPEGQYGAGAVIVWDAGPFRHLTTGEEGEAISPSEALRLGRMEVWIEGRKLRGGFALIRAQLGGDEKNWLLVKVDDECADARRNPVSTQRESVLSGRTVEQVGEEVDSQD